MTDFAQPEKGLIHNPSRWEAKLMGMPVEEVRRIMKKKEKEEEEGTTKKHNISKPGFKF